MNDETITKTMREEFFEKLKSGVKIIPRSIAQTPRTVVIHLRAGLVRGKPQPGLAVLQV
jgi:hypothetical protein